MGLEMTGDIELKKKWERHGQPECTAHECFCCNDEESQSQRYISKAKKAAKYIQIMNHAKVWLIYLIKKHE